jgi:peptide deformylase
MLLDIQTHPNKALRHKCHNVKNVLDPTVQEFIGDLKETMLKKDGVGLAARQVGHDEHIFVVNFGGKIQTFINAKFILKSFKQVEFEEGCLSVPDVYGMVKRPQTIIIKYYTEQGQLRIRKINGLEARVIQHEYDHNRGILFIDKVFQYVSGEELLNAK